MTMHDAEDVVLITEVVALPGKRDELLRAIRDDSIPDSVSQLHEDRDRPGHFMLYERFRDKGSVEAHFATQHSANISKALGELAEGGKEKITCYQALTE